MPTAGVIDHNFVDRRHTFDVHVDGRRVLAFTPRDRRVRVGLVVQSIDREVDISVSPGVAVHALRHAARETSATTEQAEAAARRALTGAADTARAWPGRADCSLSACLGGAAFPVLAAAYDQGAGSLDEMPRWAAPILAGHSARDAAVAAFGSDVTRPVIAAFASSLTRDPGAPVDLTRLVLALIGRFILQPDQLAAVLRLDGAAWAPDVLPPRQAVTDGQAATQRWGTRRTTRYLEQAITVDGGRTLLLDSIRFATDLGAHAPRRLPSNLEDLHLLYRSRMVSDAASGRDRHPTSHTGRRAQRRAPRRPDPLPPARWDLEFVPPAPAPAEVEHVAYPLLLPPPAPRASSVTASTTVPTPRWLGGAHDVTFGRFRVVLPRTCGDLDRWASLLRNCLDTYAPAAAAGRSHLIGIERSGNLAYVVEVTPTRSIRQFSGQGNRAPTRTDHDDVVSFLRSRHIIA